MENAVVNSILARCIVDPLFLGTLARDPGDALAAYKLDPATLAEFMRLDTQRIVGLAALVTKVQNNGLWQWLPYTRRLLIQHGLETEVFSAYGEIHQRNRSDGPIGQDEQTRRYLRFLEERLGRPAYRSAFGIHDMLAHERIKWEMRTACLAAAGTSGPSEGSRGDRRPPPGPFAKLVPRVQGRLLVHEFCHSPFEIAAALDRLGEFHVVGAPSPHWLGYWGDLATGQLRILELDERIARTLEAIDGERTVRAVSEQVALGGSIMFSQLKSFFLTAHRSGLLDLRPR